MIDLTRLNGHRLVLNCDLIKFAEPAPDTTITLITGEKLVVREGCDELIERTSAWRAQVLAGAGSVQVPLQGSALSAAIAFSAHQAIVTGSEQGS